MTKLTVNQTKAGDTAPKLALNLKKGEVFTIRLRWDNKIDVDLHALHTINTGAGAKASSLDDILSTYNVQRVLDGGEQAGYLPLNADKTFSIYNGALTHSPDARDGLKADDDEYIVVKPALLTKPASGNIEIPLVAMIHPQTVGKTFKDVQNARVIIENSTGQVLLDADLSGQFGSFIGVQMGTIAITDTGAEFIAVGVGFNGDFNDVLGHFS